MVCIQSVLPGHVFDDSCVLAAGEHEFVRHESFVRYDRCRKEERAKLLRAVRDGVMVARAPVSDEVYSRICEGLKVSLHTPPWARDWLNWHENLAD